jgi:hypothetical protein
MQHDMHCRETTLGVDHDMDIHEGQFYGSEDINMDSALHATLAGDMQSDTPTGIEGDTVDMANRVGQEAVASTVTDTPTMAVQDAEATADDLNMIEDQNMYKEYQVTATIIQLVSEAAN